MPDYTSFDEKDNVVSKLSDSDRSWVAQLVSKRFNRATEDIRILIEDSREGWDFYLKNRPDAANLSNKNASKPDTNNKNTTRQGVRLGGIPKAVDSVLSILHNATFPPDERFFRGTPRNSVARSNQELYEEFRAENFAEDNTTEKLRRYMLTLCIDSAACLAVPWQQKKRTKVLYESPKLVLGGIEIPLPVLGLKTKTVKDFVEWEGTCTEPLDFNDWRVDPAARCIEESWFVRRWYSPCWKVEQDYHVKDVKPYHTAIEEVYDLDGNQKRLSSGLTLPIPTADEVEGKEDALLMICYDDFIIDDQLYENHCALVLNGLKTIWFGPNPYNHGRLPYIISSLLPIPNQIYGRSLINHAIPSSAVIDTAVDKIMKIGALAADPIFEVDLMEPAFRKSRQVKPGMTFPVKRVGNAIRQVNVNVTNLSVLENIIEKMEENIREVTGASEVISGEDFNQPANITAFQVDQHVQGAHSRFQSILTNFNNSVLQELLFIAFENDKQFKTRTETLYIGTGESDLSPDLIKQMEFKWVITSSTAANARGKRVANLQALINMAPVLLQTGILTLSNKQLVMDQEYVLTTLATLGGEPDADLIFKSMPPPPPMPPPMMPQPGVPPNGLPGVPQAGPGPPGQLPPAPPGQPPIQNPNPAMPGPMPPGPPA